MRGVPVLLLVCALLPGCSGGDGPLGPEAREQVAAAVAHLEGGDPAAAIAAYEQALELAPGHVETRLALALVQRDQGDLAAARAQIGLVLQQQPDNARAHLERGKVLVLQGFAEQALRDFDEAERRAPGRAEALAARGAVLVSLGRHAQALPAFSRADALPPGLSYGELSSWALALEQTGDLDAAAGQYERATALAAPDDARAFQSLGLLLLRKDADGDRALPLLQEALRRSPGDPATLHALGSLYLAKERPAEAHGLFQRALAATDPDSKLYSPRARDLARAAAALPRAVPPPDSPNLVLIVIDTLRADHVGAYGYARDTTPAIDALAAQGVVFERAVAQAPWTAASVATLMTGLYPSVHGLDGGIRWGRGRSSAEGQLPFEVQRTLRPSQLTLAEILRRSGYRTAGFVSNVQVNSIFGFAHGFEHYDDRHRDYSPDTRRVKRRGAALNAEVFRWLEAELEEPFLLFVHYNDPHWPYAPPAPFGSEWVSGYAGELRPVDTGNLVEQAGRPVELAPADLDYLVGLYDGEIAYADAQVAALLARVEALDLKRDVLTVLTADHGEEFLDHGSTSHGFTLYEEQLRVPLVLHQPGRLTARRITSSVGLVDVLPSLLELIGIEPPHGLQGLSFAPGALGLEELVPPFVYSEASYTGSQKAVRDQAGLKLIESFAEGPSQAFDLAQDPAERENLAATRDETALRSVLGDWSQQNADLRLALDGVDSAPQ